MKRLIMFPLLATILLLGCNNAEVDQELDVDPTIKSATLSHTPKSAKITLSADKETKEKLFLKDHKGNTANAIKFVSEVNAGDTIFWQVNESSFISSVEEIIIVKCSTCKNPFPNGFIFNADKTECYGVVAPNASGTIKYDIKYKCKNGKVITVDPVVQIKPPQGMN